MCVWDPTYAALTCVDLRGVFVIMLAASVLCYVWAMAGFMIISSITLLRPAQRRTEIELFFRQTGKSDAISHTSSWPRRTAHTQNNRAHSHSTGGQLSSLFLSVHSSVSTDLPTAPTGQVQSLQMNSMTWVFQELLTLQFQLYIVRVSFFFNTILIQFARAFLKSVVPVYVREEVEGVGKKQPHHQVQRGCWSQLCDKN